MSTLRDKIKRAISSCNRVGKYGTQDFNADEALEKIMREIEKGPKLLINIDNVRPTVDWYAQRMEKRLKEKNATRGKDSWHDGKLAYYTMMAIKCLNNIVSLFREDDRQFPNEGIINPLSLDIKLEGIGNIKEKDIHFAIKKCIDGGNFFMKLADNFRDELIKRGIK